MAEYEVEHTMPADAEIVFGVASDVSLLDRWLPAHFASAGPNQVRVSGELDGRQVEETGLIDARADQLRMEWGSRDDGDYAGWLQVEHAGAGSSSVLMHLSFFGEHQPEQHGEADPEDAMRAALDRLAEEVATRSEG